MCCQCQTIQQSIVSTAAIGSAYPQWLSCGKTSCAWWCQADAFVSKSHLASSCMGGLAVHSSGPATLNVSMLCKKSHIVVVYKSERLTVLPYTVHILIEPTYRVNQIPLHLLYFSIWYVPGAYKMNSGALVSKRSLPYLFTISLWSINISLKKKISLWRSQHIYLAIMIWHLIATHHP